MQKIPSCSFCLVFDASGLDYPIHDLSRKFLGYECRDTNESFEKPQGLKSWPVIASFPQVWHPITDYVEAFLNVTISNDNIRDQTRTFLFIIPTLSAS